MKHSREQLQQREFGFTNRGGKRRGAGRKPKGERALMSHAKQPRLHRRFPVLLTLKLRDALSSLAAPAGPVVRAPRSSDGAPGRATVDRGPRSP